MRIPSKSKCEHPVNSNYTLPLRRTQDSARGSRSRSVDDDCTINCRHLLLRPPFPFALNEPINYARNNIADYTPTGRQNARFAGDLPSWDYLPLGI